MDRKLSLLLLALLATAASGCERETQATAPAIQQETEDFGAMARPPAPVEIVMPEANARRGRILFIANGCVICHQVNGVGGTAAPALDINRQDRKVDPLAFSAAMWRGAEAMTALQTMQRGYVIQLDGQDIADLAAFAASPEERALLTDESVSDEMRSWFLAEPYWTQGEWRDYLEHADEYPFDSDLPNSDR